MRLTPDYPPVWLAGFMAAAWGVAQVHAPFGDHLLWLGRGLTAAGLLVMLWAGLAFRRARTTIIPHEPPSALVETGPYRFSRNPIYAADLVILAGWALSLGAPLALVLVVPFHWILRTRFIEPEEARLRDGLGQAYADYKTRVRRWI